MRTKFWHLDDKNQADVLQQAAAMIKAGGTVAFPTETVYGLAANGLSQQAVEKIFAAKGRPADNPLILHIAERQEVYALANEVTEDARKLIDAFWPGPLTIILRKQAHIPDAVTAGLATVAVRMPSHPLAKAFIAMCGVPLAAPSANVSGRPSPTDAQTVKADLWGRIDGIIDGGSTQVGLESTVVDCSGTVPVILRPGAVTYERLVKVVALSGSAIAGEAETPKAPGMKYRHYAPCAPVYLFNANDDLNDLEKICAQLSVRNLQAGVIASAEVAQALPASVLSRSWTSREQLANNLYSWLRELDSAGAKIIFAQRVDECELGTAIMNRLGKAAAGKNISSPSAVKEILQALPQDL